MMISIPVNELAQRVPILQGYYVRLINIPNPYRSEFFADSMGSTCPVVEGEGMCHYSWDWEKWLSIRSSPDYTLRSEGSYKEISDEAQLQRDEKHRLQFKSKKN